MKYKILFIFIVMLFYYSCIKSTSSNKKSPAVNIPPNQVSVVESENLIGECNESKSAQMVYVKNTQKLMICVNNKWEVVKNETTQIINNPTNNIIVNSLTEQWREIWINNVQKITYVWVKYKLESSCDILYTWGSGFVVQTNIVVTNGHVVNHKNCNIEWIKVYFPDDVSMVSSVSNFELVTHLDKSIINTDDIVLLKVNTKTLTPVVLSSLDEAQDRVKGEGVKIGDDVMLLAYTGGTPFVHLTTGKINAIQKISKDFLYDLILSEIINEGKIIYEYDLISGVGSSGAPVFNIKGEVIGIHFAGNNASADTEFGYAIQIKPLRNLLLAPRQWTPIQ